MANHFLKPTFKRGYDEHLEQKPMTLSAIEPGAGHPLRYVAFINRGHPDELLHGRLVAIEVSLIEDSNELNWPITVLHVAVEDNKGAISYVVRVVPPEIPDQFQFVTAHSYLKKAIVRGREILTAREVLK
jgi:hypothetical protein